MLTCVSAVILLCSFQSGITDLVLQPDHAPLLKANPLLMEIPGAKVIKTDIVADNGVIHVIDTVLMPK